VKSFAGVTVVKGVDIRLEPGEAHALVGENGAGKSTLIKMLAGVHQPDSGEIQFEGRTVTIANPSAAHQLGVFTVHQEPALMPQLSVAENVFMGFLPMKKRGVFRWVDRNAMFAEAERVFQRLEISMDVRQMAAQLTIAQQQMVEIAKSLIHQTKVLILDEPTATLSVHETEILFRIVRRLQSEGTAILFVSHRLQEVFSLCSKVTVMRDGERVGVYETVHLDENRLVSLMVGRNINLNDTERREIVRNEPILKVSNLTRRPWFEDVTFDLYPGEILGMAGLVGAGRTNVAEALFGVAPAQSGEIELGGKVLRIRNARQAIAEGIVYVPEDRHKHGVALWLPIRTNMTLPSLANLSKWGITQPRVETRLSEEMVRELNVKTTSVLQLVSQLSGGNQQKVVFAKWVSRKPRIMILDEPTRGVDVGAKSEIYRIIRSLADTGVAVLVISSDLPEILALSDRVLVMKEGRLVADLDKAHLSEENIMRHATGVKATVS
jgi:ABC-type sugar transport system ATPase subunit